MKLFILLLKGMSKSTDLRNSNELKAVHFAVIKSLASVTSGYRGKYRNVKISVEVPLSQEIFG